MTGSRDFHTHRPCSTYVIIPALALQLHWLSVPLSLKSTKYQEERLRREFTLAMEALFLFCCEPCLRGDDDSREFYDFLGVSQSASSDEIRSAYRRKALALHPDKLKQKGVTITAEHNEEVCVCSFEFGAVCGELRRWWLYVCSSIG